MIEGCDEVLFSRLSLLEQIYPIFIILGVLFIIISLAKKEKHNKWWYGLVLILVGIALNIVINFRYSSCIIWG